MPSRRRSFAPLGCEQSGADSFQEGTIGVGATDEFDSDPASNRRVVITVSPHVCLTGRALALLSPSIPPPRQGGRTGGPHGPIPGVAFVLAKDGAQWFVSSQNWIPVGGKFRVFTYGAGVTPVPWGAGRAYFSVRPGGRGISSQAPRISPR